MIDYDGLTFTGGANELINSTVPQIILFGPWVSGKSFALTSKAHLLCKNYPGITVGMLTTDRERVRYMLSPLYRSVINKSDTNIEDMEIRETKSRVNVQYPNGSQIACTELEGAIAWEFDYVSMFDVEFMTQYEWEIVVSRTRRGKLPFHQVAGDFTWKFDHSFDIGNKTEWVWDNQNIHKVFQSYYNNPQIYDSTNSKFTDYGDKIKNKFFSSGIWQYQHNTEGGWQNKSDTAVAGVPE